MFRIGEFSVLAKTTVKTIRFYDEIDLFKPMHVDSNGYRYYSIEQLNDLQKIIELRNISIPLDEIKEVLNGKDIVTILEKRKTEILYELAKSQEELSLIKNYIAKAKKGVFMEKYQAKEIVIPESIVYFKHGIIDNMSELVPFILSAGEEVRKHNPNLKCCKEEYCFVTYGAKEYKETDIEVEYAEAVVAFGNESENIKFKKLNEVKAISIMHKGSYSRLGEAYAFGVNYIKEKGLTIAEPIRERYINGCWDTENENNYLTEIQIPIK